MLALYILGGVLLALLILLLVPVRAEVAFHEAFQLTIGYGPLRFPIPLEGGEGAETPEAPPPPEKKEGPGRLKLALRRAGFWGFLQSLADFIGTAAQATGKLLGHFKLKRFDLYLRLGGAEDAAAAAVRYGQVSGAVYSACGLLFSLLPCKEKGVAVDLDYSTLENTVDFSACLSLRPLFALAAGARVLIGALPLFRLLRGRPGKDAPQKGGEGPARQGKRKRGKAQDKNMEKERDVSV